MRLEQVRVKIHTLEADFLEERSIPSLAVPLKFRGKIYYSDKGLFFMEYTNPVHHILRIKGDKALFFVEGSKIADLVDISGVNGIAVHPDIFAVNPGRFAGQVWESEDSYLLKQIQNEDNAKNRLPRLKVFLDKKTLLVEKIVIQDEDGDATHIFLFNVKTNQALPRSVLTFKIPEGVKINRLTPP
jgi:outer membrane lipoprotein-sorting protein